MTTNVTSSTHDEVEGKVHQAAVGAGGRVMHRAACPVQLCAGLEDLQTFAAQLE